MPIDQSVYALESLQASLLTGTFGAFTHLAHSAITRDNALQCLLVSRHARIAIHVRLVYRYLQGLSSRRGCHVELMVGEERGSGGEDTQASEKRVGRGQICAVLLNEQVNTVKGRGVEKSQSKQ